MTYYYIRESGNDLNTGISGTAAWRTFTPANEAGKIQNGDWVSVGRGTGFGTLIPWPTEVVTRFTFWGPGVTNAGEGIDGAGFPPGMKGVHIYGVKTIQGGFIVIGDSDGIEVNSNWIRGIFVASGCKGAVIESNFFQQIDGYVQLTVPDRGSFKFQHNTLTSDTLNAKPQGAMFQVAFAFQWSPADYMSVKWPYCWVFNNAFYRAPTDPNLLIKYGIRDWGFWDSYYLHEGNWFEYTAASGDFGIIEDVPVDLFTHTYADYSEWVSGFNPWAGRDILGGVGEFHLGEDPGGNTNGYSLGWDSILINRAIYEEKRAYDYDIEATHRKTFGRSDVGCYEVWESMAEYTIFGFTSKMYANVTGGAVPIQCVLFMDYELDFPDCALVKATFNGGLTWCTIVDTWSGIDYSKDTFSIPEPDRGIDLQVKIELWIHRTNLCKPDIGTPMRVDLEYFSEASLGIYEKIKKGSEIDIYDSEFNFIQRTVPGQGDHFETYLPPGTYNLKVSGGGHPATWTQADVGHGTWFGRYSEQPADIWHQFHKARAYTTFIGVQWASYMIWDQFGNQTKRAGGEPEGCPPLPINDPYYPNVLVVRSGKALKCRSGIDQFFLCFDPTLFPELEGG
jgi:hypothetical protein